MKGWIDTHCHIQEPYLGQQELSQVLARARKQSVSGVICVGTDLASSEAAINLATNASSELEDFILGISVGLHPHEANQDVTWLKDLVSSSLDKKVKLRGIGECGLDFYYMHSSKNEQIEAFQEQIKIAQEYGLPLIVHCRDAFPCLIEILKNTSFKSNVIIHCFTGERETLRQLVDLDCFISFSGIVTFKSAEGIREALLSCPIDKILIETDSPFLAPVPYRGQVNEPKNVAVIGTFIAGFLSMSEDELKEHLFINSSRAFGLDI